ncbi:energy transducer TonB [Fluviicola taffensis]|uniref:TonB family protein n=1 Tax=Fluviicola taffensis (strain DSM 16823 / NCIMB 13979 / RW262) TaxID=755732 RepID=F2IC24_FLUTR|nr:energy transducer TonB [Fluviicola taffensis]AEA43250.1 TonB family protein [Fluviicola taffensis DSM 16823]
MKLKNLVLISAIQFICGTAFTQTTEWEAAPPPTQEAESKTKKPTVNESGEVFYDIVDEGAEFPGGLGALKKYMSENLTYPQIALEKGISGKCFIQVYILKDGSISNVAVKKGVADCPECDAEAVRMVKGMPKWIPAKINGQVVNSTYNLPVTFKLN